MMFPLFGPRTKDRIARVFTISGKFNNPRSTSRVYGLDDFVYSGVCTA